MYSQLPLYDQAHLGHVNFWQVIIVNVKGSVTANLGVLFSRDVHDRLTAEHRVEVF